MFVVLFSFLLLGLANGEAQFSYTNSNGVVVVTINVTDIVKNLTSLIKPQATTDTPLQTFFSNLFNQFGTPATITFGRNLEEVPQALILHPQLEPVHVGDVDLDVPQQTEGRYDYTAEDLQESRKVRVPIYKAEPKSYRLYSYINNRAYYADALYKRSSRVGHKPN